MSVYWRGRVLEREIILARKSWQENKGGKGKKESHSANRECVAVAVELNAVDACYKDFCHVCCHAYVSGAFLLLRHRGRA